MHKLHMRRIDQVSAQPRISRQSVEEGIEIAGGWVHLHESIALVDEDLAGQDGICEQNHPLSAQLKAHSPSILADKSV
jgi:hypothetical protein